MSRFGRDWFPLVNILGALAIGTLIGQYVGESAVKEPPLKIGVVGGYLSVRGFDNKGTALMVTQNGDILVKDQKVGHSNDLALDWEIIVHPDKKGFTDKTF